MMIKYNFRMIMFLLMILMIFSDETICQEKKEYSSIRDAFLSTRILIGKREPANLQWIAGGSRYSFTIRNDSTKHNEIREFDPGTLEDKLLLDPNKLNFPQTEEHFSYTSFKWAIDSKHILFQSNFRPIYRISGTADYYLYSFDDNSLKLLFKDARSAELSPDGTMVGSERDGNIYVYNISESTEKQLTSDGSDSIYNGHFDWVYEEEFELGQGWRWSPDSKYIAFWQLDETQEPLYQMTDYEGQHPEYTKFRVPLVGDPNAKVRIGVLNVKTGARIWLNNSDEYIPRIYWTSQPDQLAMITLNRKQNDMKLYFYNVTTGDKKLTLEEKSDTWVDIDNFYEGVTDMIYFPDDTKEFFFISDRDGYQHIYRYDYQGNLLNQVTRGNWTVTRIEGINLGTKTIFYTSTEISPLERHLYSIKFDGTDKKELSTASGNHKYNLSPNTKYYIDTYSNISTPAKVELWETTGKMLTRLQDNKKTSDFLKDHKYSPLNLFHFETTDGVRLDGDMIKPFDFDSTKKYPVIFDVYGGPNSQGVFNTFAWYGWDQWLAQEGYIIVDLNNRGNANYGRDFMKIVYDHLGKWESNDYVETLKYLSTLPYIDTSRTAIMGTSYGGYITIYTMLTHPGLFKVGIANSAVADWQLYDDIYTERYMGLKDENVEGYKESSNVEQASNLQGKLLIIHSTMDDNVHVQNTMQLLTAFTNAGKDVDLRIYPPGGHGAVYSLESQLLMLEETNDYLARYLKGK